MTRRNEQILTYLPFVQMLARKMAASMQNSVDTNDLIQDGVIGLIDAMIRFDKKRDVEFKTFAQRRIRGAMLDALRKGSWPKRLRKRRRELDAARETLRSELGHEPSLTELAAKIGYGEERLVRNMVRIRAIESISIETSVPETPDALYGKIELDERIRKAIGLLSEQDRKLIKLYYYDEMKMKTIGTKLGINESRASQIHRRALKRLKELLK